jgi:hypothetical protein
MVPEESEFRLQQRIENETNQQENHVDIEELAKEIMRLLKKNLREENERSPR